MPLQDVLSRLPVVAGYEAGRQQNMNIENDQIQQAAGLQGLMAKMQAQQREEQFRSEIAKATTPEEKLAVATKYMGPDKLGSMVQSSQDRAAQIAATKEATMARLTQQATTANQMFSMKEQQLEVAKRNAKTAEERAQLEREGLTLKQQHEAFTQRLQSEAARLAGAQGQYNFGFTPSAVPTTMQPASPGGPPAAPAGVPPGMPTGAPEGGAFRFMTPSGEITEGTVGSDQQAVSLEQALQRQSPMPPRGAPAQPAIAPPAPSAPLGALAPTPSATTPVAQTAPTTPQLPPMPPEIASAPMRVQNEWKMARAKEAASNKPPSGYRLTSDQNLEAIPGGPADLKAKGKEEGRGQISTIANTLAAHYNNLEKMGAVIQPKQSTIKNVWERAAASGPGQMVAGAVGTKAQEIRDQIANSKPLLMAAIKQASGMSSQQLNSNAELQFYLQAATDPAKSLESNRAALAVLDQTYGLGNGIKANQKAIDSIKKEAPKPGTQAGGVKFMGFE